MSNVQPNNLTTISRMIGLDHNDLIEYLNWCLLEHLLHELVESCNLNEIRSKKNALDTFKQMVEKRTGTKWDFDNIRTLYEKAIQLSEKHHRQKITYEEFLRLLINTPLTCAKCKKAPPEVTLHIDHVHPASKGGSSLFENLRFLCAKCNLTKSDKIERGKLWLKLESLQQN